MTKVLRPKQQCEMLGISRATLHRLGKDPAFPKSINLGDKSVGREESELLAWLESRKGITRPPVVAPEIKRGRRRKSGV